MFDANSESWTEVGETKEYFYDGAITTINVDEIRKYCTDDFKDVQDEENVQHDFSLEDNNTTKIEKTV